MPEHDETPNPVLVDNITERATLSKATLARLRARLVEYGELMHAEGGPIALIEVRPNHEPIDEFDLGYPYADRYRVQVDRIWEHWRETTERYGYLPRDTVDTRTMGRDYLTLLAPPLVLPSPHPHQLADGDGRLVERLGHRHPNLGPAAPGPVGRPHPRRPRPLHRKPSRLPKGTAVTDEIDEIEPDFYASILTLEHDEDNGALRLIVATTESTESDPTGAEADVVLTAELPEFDPINAANKILYELADEGVAHWDFLRGWYEDGDALRAELEGNPNRLRYQRVDIYFLDADQLGQREEFRLCKHSATDYLMIMPQSDDKFEIWREDGVWRTDAPTDEGKDFGSLADLVEQAFLTA